jgi:RimJ/RimL family protein N-acetyltransferase
MAAHHDDDVHDAVIEWLSSAERDRSIYYFGVQANGELVGQIFLHDIDEETGEALVGYHLFEKRFRGRGIGTIALQLLQTFVAETTRLTRLILITSGTNIASRRAAEKAGFVSIGAPREDASGVVLVWDVPLHGLRVTGPTC